MKKILALVLALVMVLMVGAAFATDGTITITPPTGVDPAGSNSYPIYKVFDAVYSANGISYTVMSTKSGVPDVAAQMESGYNAATTNHFIVDTAGNVHYGTQAADGTITDAASDTEMNDATIKAIAAYVAGDTPVATATSTGTTAASAEIPQDGYYYISTTTGTAVTITSFRPHVSVDDKNKIPEPEKEIFGVDVGSFDTDGKAALAQVGTDVDYRVTFDIEKGAKGYKFHDTMSAGLSYNNDVVVKVNGAQVNGGANTWQTETVNGETITIAFVDAYVAAHIGEPVVIEYSAKITSDALQRVPGTNTVKITYGNESSYNSTEDHTDVYNAKFTVTKEKGDGTPLQGAGFVLKNSQDKYYHLVAAAGTTPAHIVWEDDIDAATEYTSDANGAVNPFTGLVDGTYTLIEKTVPEGYNKAADYSFTIDAHDYTTANLEQSTTVVNNAGTELPSTGGIGTTIFYIVGGLLVIGAAVILVARRKSHE